MHERSTIKGSFTGIAETVSNRLKCGVERRNSSGNFEASRLKFSVISFQLMTLVPALSGLEKEGTRLKNVPFKSDGLSKKTRPQSAFVEKMDN